MNYKKLAEQTEPYIIEQRHWFHQHPELSWEEFQTTDAIVAQLEAMGLEAHRFDGITGCWALLKGGKSGPNAKTVALRADIDALPVLEKTGLPFASENEGVMHACGHDNHIAMLLGAAKMLTETKDELYGNVKFIFQSAEETCCGSKKFIEQGFLNGVDAIFGQHIWGNMDAPYINVQSGRRMASCDTFVIKVEGVSAHGTAPHLGKDAIVAAASIIMNAQTFASRMNDPMNPMVLTIGEMHAGQRFNIIANHAELFGTIRTFNAEFRATVEERLRHIVEETADALGCTATLEYTYTAGPVINDHEDLNEIAQNAVVELYGEDTLKPLPMMMGSEDFAYYMEEVPGIFGFLGSRDIERGYDRINHNDGYTVPEDVLKRGAALHAQFAADYLEKNRD